MKTGSTISEAQAAWRRIRDRDKASFEDWLSIGRALIAGRQECMAKAGVNKPYSPAYQKLMRAWLDENGFAEIDGQERRGAIHCVERQGEIEAWRSGLTDAERRRSNHPNTIIKHMQRLTAPQRSGPRRSLVKVPKHADKRAIHWPQPIIRRAALAIAEARTNDTIRLAIAALEAAIPNEASLFALLEPPKPRKPVQTTTAPVMAEATA